MNASWVVPEGGNINCGIAQPGVVGAPKIWFPATNAFRTCYFRNKFSISQLCEVKTVKIEIATADNYIIYVNGFALASGDATAKTVNIPVQLLQYENVAFIKNPWAKPLVTTIYNLIVSIQETNCKKDRSMTVVVKPCTPGCGCYL